MHGLRTLVRSNTKLSKSIGDNYEKALIKSAIENNVTKYCYYSYVDAKTIRVRFDSLSYLPTLNADVEILIRTTRGEEGNFEYEGVIPLALTSERFDYKRSKGTQSQKYRFDNPERQACCAYRSFWLG